MIRHYVGLKLESKLAPTPRRTCNLLLTPPEGDPSDHTPRSPTLRRIRDPSPPLWVKHSCISLISPPTPGTALNSGSHTPPRHERTRQTTPLTTAAAQGRHTTELNNHTSPCKTLCAYTPHLPSPAPLAQIPCQSLQPNVLILSSSPLPFTSPTTPSTPNTTTIPPLYPHPCLNPRPHPCLHLCLHPPCPNRSNHTLSPTIHSPPQQTQPSTPQL